MLPENSFQSILNVVKKIILNNVKFFRELENWFQKMLSVLRVILSINSPKQFLNSNAHPPKKKYLFEIIYLLQ